MSRKMLKHPFVVFICMCYRYQMCHAAHVEVKDTMNQSVLFFYQIDSAN